MSLLSNMRDKAVEAFIKNHPMVKEFGDIASLSINSSEGFADVELMLHGEVRTIKFRGYYYFDDTDNGTDIVIRKITSERKWIDEALAFCFEKTTLRYPLPKIASGLAKILF